MSLLVTFLIMVAFWVFLSGLLDPWHFGLGLLCCALVSYMSHDLLFRDFKLRPKLIEYRRFIQYLPWLLYQIYLANVYVVKLALSPRMQDRIYPHVVKFRTRLKSDLALVVFADSITLTPGTITVLIEDDIFYVHAIDRSVAESLPGTMEERVGHIFGEE